LGKEVVFVTLIVDTQSVSQIIIECPVNKFEGGLPSWHTASDSVREWLRRVHHIY